MGPERIVLEFAPCSGGLFFFFHILQKETNLRKKERKKERKDERKKYSKKERKKKRKKEGKKESMKIV